MITVKMDQKSLSMFRKNMDKYAKLTGKTMDQVLREFGKVAADQCCHLTHPLGVSEKVGKKFKGSIRKQIYRGVAAQLGQEPLIGRIAEIHKKARLRGVVPRRRLGTIRKQIPRKFTPNERAEIDALAAQKQAIAGRMKAAWLKAGGMMVATKTIRVAKQSVGKWIKVHISKGMGRAKVTGKYPRQSVTIINDTPYITKKHFKSDDDAIARALHRQGNRMKAAIRAQLKKTI